MLFHPFCSRQNLDWLKKKISQVWKETTHSGFQRNVKFALAWYWYSSLPNICRIDFAGQILPKGSFWLMKSLWLPNNTEICIVLRYVVLWHQRLAQVREVSGAGQCWWWSNLHAFSVGIEFLHWYNCMGISNYFCQKLDLKFNSVLYLKHCDLLSQRRLVWVCRQKHPDILFVKAEMLTNSWMHVWGNKLIQDSHFR